jgi:hypothetical protein
MGALVADNSGFGTLRKGTKNQDQVPGGVIAANGDDYLVTAKPAMEERRADVEFEVNKTGRCTAAVLFAASAMAPTHKATQGTLVEGDERPFR